MNFHSLHGQRRRYFLVVFLIVAAAAFLALERLYQMRSNSQPPLYHRAIRPSRLSLFASDWSNSHLNALLNENRFNRGLTDQAHIYPRDLPQWINDYTVAHALALREPDRQRYLVYHCSNTTGLCGGAGDRLGGMVTLFYVAMVSGRIFLVNHSSPFPLQETMIENLVRWSAALPATIERRINSMDRFDRDLTEPTKLRSVNGSIVVQCNRFPVDTLWGSDAMREYLAGKALRL